MNKRHNYDSDLSHIYTDTSLNQRHLSYAFSELDEDNCERHANKRKIVFPTLIKLH